MLLIVIACSGPGAMDAIASNLLYAQQCAIGSACLAALSCVLWLLHRKLGIISLLTLGILALHPAWTVSAISGDCGGSTAQFATLVTITSGCLVATQLLGWLSTGLQPPTPGNHPS